MKNRPCPSASAIVGHRHGRTVWVCGRVVFLLDCLQIQAVMVGTVILGSEGQHKRYHLTYATQSGVRLRQHLTLLILPPILLWDSKQKHSGTT